MSALREAVIALLKDRIDNGAGNWQDAAWWAHLLREVEAEDAE